MTVFSSNYGARTKTACALLLILLAFARPVATQQKKPSDPPPGASTPSPVLKQIIANQEECEKTLDEYQRVMRTESRRIAGDPNIESKAWLMFPIGTGSYKIPLAPDGKAPAPDAYRSELEKIEKYLAWLTQNGSSQREAYAKAERKRKERLDLLRATYQAFIFTRDGEETRDGRTLVRYIIKPNPAYKPTSRNTAIFTKVRGTVWIDEQSSQMAKIDGSVTDDISIGLFLAKVYRGSHFMQERYEVAPGIWEPTFEQYDFDGRKFLYAFSIHERTFYSAYKHIGPPKQALSVVRAELNKARHEPSSP